MGTTTTTFALNKPTVGGDDNAWGTDWNTNADKLDDLLDGTTAVKPNLSEGLWKVGGVAVTSTAAELNFTDGVTSAIQTQLDAKQASDADLTAIAGLSSSGMIARTGAGTAAARTITGSNHIRITDGDGVAGNPTVFADTASAAEAEGGTNNAKLMTPLRTAQAISALSTVLLGTLTTTSGSVQTLSGLVLTDYKFLHFTLNAVSTSGSTGTIGLGPITDLFGPAAGGSSVSGMACVDLGNGVATAPTKLSADSRVSTGASGYSTATTSVSVNVSAGTFDAGSILIYGVK